MRFKTVLFKRTCESEFEKGIQIRKNSNTWIILTEDLESVEEIWDFRETRDFMLNINFRDIYPHEEE